MTTHDVVDATLIILVPLNIVISVAIACVRGLSSRQKILQILIVWMIPFLGSFLLGLFILGERSNAQRRNRFGGNDENLNQIWQGSDPGNRH
jgi:hypothetical protein